MILRGRLSGRQQQHLRGLLDMEYSPGELAQIIKITRNQFYRVYEKAGCPFRRDETGHIWINGKRFWEWYHMHYPKITLSDNEVFCLTCKRGVEINCPSKEIKSGLTFIVCICPHCGRKISKLTENNRREGLNKNLELKAEKGKDDD